jgi:hypothetical protein
MPSLCDLLPDLDKDEDLASIPSSVTNIQIPTQD